MQRLITQLWAGLVRYHPAEGGDTVEERDEEEYEFQARDAEIDEAHRNQYWTRVVSM